MATKTSTPATPQIAVPGVSGFPIGTPFFVYQKGVDAYDTMRVNGDVDLKLDNGEVKTGKITAMQVGPLVDLLVNTGPQSALTYGRIYSPLSLVQSLTDQAGVEALDVTRLYTAISVTMPIPQPSTNI